MLTEQKESLCTSFMCDPNALCSKTEGAYVCRCGKGFTGDGRTCVGNTERVCLPLG